MELKDLRNHSIFSWTLTWDTSIGTFVAPQLSRAMAVRGQGKLSSENPAHLVLKKPHFEHDFGSGTLDSTNTTRGQFQVLNQLLPWSVLAICLMGTRMDLHVELTMPVPQA